MIAEIRKVGLVFAGLFVFDIFSFPCKMVAGSGDDIWTPV